MKKKKIGKQRSVNKVGEISRLKTNFRRKIGSVGESLNTYESVSNFPVKDRSHGNFYRVMKPAG